MGEAVRGDETEPNLHAPHGNVNQSTESLCVRLRRERERRQIALSSISANTKIGTSLFEGLERGDVSRWPAGIYRRSFIRAYASAIGLDPDATAKEFLELFPDPLDTPAAVDIPVVEAPAVEPPVVAVPEKKVRVRVAETGQSFVAGPLLTGLRTRAVAAACDAGVVVAIAVCGFIASGAFWLPLGVVMLAYHIGGILLLGNTPGVCLLATAARRESEPAPTYNRTSHELDAATANGTAHPSWHFRMPAR